jgi:putative ABC transport system substrate-binding protein
VKRREFFTLLGGAAAAWPLAARAQQLGKVYRVAFFTAGALAVPLSVFVQALQQLGWIEGKNIVLEIRYADNRLDRLPEMAAELVRLKVDVIVARQTGNKPAPNRIASSTHNNGNCRGSLLRGKRRLRTTRTLRAACW